MGKIRKGLTFDNSFLSKLKEEENTCVEIIKSVHHLALHPFHLADISESVKEVLNERIAKYDKELNGILIGYQNIKFVQSTGSINFDSCFIHLDIQAEFYLFKPEVGKILNGVVNKKSKDHVGCLVHQIFNVSLPKPESCEDWLGDEAKIGQEIQLQITFTDFEGRLPYIRAVFVSILSEDSGISTSEEGHTEGQSKVNKIIKFDDDLSEETSAPKRKRKLSLSATETANKRIKTDEGEEPKVKKSKKHKREKYSEPDVAAADEDNEISVDKKKKKKKKHKDEKTVDVEVEEVDGSETRHKRNDALEENGRDRERNGQSSTEISDCKKKHKRNKKVKDAEAQQDIGLDDIFAEISEDLNCNGAKVKSKESHKKSKRHKDVVQVEVEDSSHARKKSKKKKKRRDVESDTSLPELNLKVLFSESDVRRRGESYMWDSKTIDLPPDSDLENILSGIKGTNDADALASTHKHKRHSTTPVVNAKVKRRRKNSSSEEFVTPVKKIRK